MVEESGTLESQLEATKVSDVHLWLKQHFQLAWKHRAGREMHGIVWENLNLFQTFGILTRPQGLSVYISDV